MSANYWAICPRCKNRAIRERSAISDQVREAYGNVPVEEWEALSNRVRAPLDEETFRTFREDYEFYGAEEGTIIASYGGSCDVCGLSAELHSETPFWDKSQG